MFAIILALATAAPIDPATTQRDVEQKGRDSATAEYVAEKMAEEAKKKGLVTARREAESTRENWDNCLKRFADNASEVEIDPGSEVVRTAFLACSTERGHAEWAWGQQIYLASRYQPAPATARKWATEAYDKFTDLKRDGLLVRVSQTRQLARLKREREAIERELRDLRRK